MKNLKNLGKALSKAEQKTINGGRKPFLCGPMPNTVICGHRSQCQQLPDGSWNCNG